jgi:hypothetical protein
VRFIGPATELAVAIAGIEPLRPLHPHLVEVIERRLSR